MLRHPRACDIAQTVVNGKERPGIREMALPGE
jgi:hypothetical protein